MTLTLEVSPEEHSALIRQARALGTTPEAVLRGLIAGLPPLPLLAGELDDPEEQAEQDRERAEIAANVLRWRAERGVTASASPWTDRTVSPGPSPSASPDGR